MPILTAIDDADASSRTLEVGYELAQDCDEELIVLHVMPQEAFDEFQNATRDDTVRTGVDGVTYERQSGASSAGGSSGKRYTVEDGQQNAENVATRLIEETLDTRAGVTARGRVGDPVKEILDEAARSDARYLVIGGRKRTPVGKAIFGSITQSILLNAELPVLAVMSEE